MSRISFAATDEQRAEFVAALERNGLRRCMCTSCGCALEAWSRDQAATDPTAGPRGGWICVPCGGEVQRASD